MSKEVNFVSGVDLEKMLKEMGAKVYMPKHNIKFEMNISGMSGDELAFALYTMSRIVKGASAGYEGIECDWEPPFLRASITYEEGDEYTSTAIITGIRRKEDGENWVIELSPEFCNIAESEDIAEAIFEGMWQ